MQEAVPTLIYIGDPMCSWCYGIAPEITKVTDNYSSSLSYELIMGGLRPYNTEKMNEMKDFLSHHWEEVNERTGQSFSYGILDSPDISYDTEPPSRATVVVRHMAPEKEMVFFKNVQISFYSENKNLHLAESYQSSVEELGLDYDEFAKLFESDQMKNEVKLDFEKAQKMGMRGFPTLVLKHNEQLFLVANGFATHESIIERIDQVMQK